MTPSKPSPDKPQRIQCTRRKSSQKPPKFKPGDRVVHVHGKHGIVEYAYVAGCNLWISVRWDGPRSDLLETMARCCELEKRDDD